MKNILLVLFLFCSLLGYSQDMKVSGTVYDTTGTKPLKNAVAMAIRIKDSLLLSFDRTDANGHFNLKGLQKDTFTLVITHPDTDDKTYFIFGNDDNLDIKIDNIKMPPKSQLIDEVVIYAFKDPIYYKGDTLVYIADSFKVGENAVVEDLLKKLPGIEIDKDGKIKSQGQDISKVLVDGDEFFGDDPTIATKNLAAKGIETVQVYEAENDDGTFGSDEKIKVLDLKLKEDAKKGYFGRISGASDFGATRQGQPFYEGELLLNRFNGSQKISIFALGSNTPRSNFGWGDINKFGLDNETGGNRWNGQGLNNNNGIPQTLKAGIYYSDKFGKKKNAKFGFNYSYYNTEMDASTASRSQFFLADTTYFTDDSTRNLSRNESHKFNLDFSTKLDSLTSIYIEPSVRLDFAKTDETNFTSFLSEDFLPTISTFANNTNKSDGLEFETTLGIERKFKKPKRVITADYFIKMTDNNTAGNLLTRSQFMFGDTVVDQSKNNNNNSINHSVYADFTEPLGKLFKLTVGYNFMTGTLNQDRSTFDRVGDAYSAFRTDLSNIFESQRLEHRGGVKLFFEKKKHYAFVRMDARNISIENLNLISLNTINQNVSNFLPSFEYGYKPSMSKRFNVAYSTQSSLPSINDLQPVPDNTNPNRIAQGNPDLKPTYEHNVEMNFNAWQAMSGSYVWSGLNASFIDNAFGNSTSFDAFGRSNSQTVNVDGNTNISIYGGGGLPFYQRKFTFQPFANLNYSRNTNFINNEKNVTDNYYAGVGMELRFELDSLEISVNTNIDYFNPRSSLNAVSNTPYSNQTYGARFMWRLPKGFKIETDFDYTINGQRAEGYNLNFFIWNAELSKSFLKTENLVLALIGKDLLDQNINAQRQVIGNIVVDNRTKIISRYFLLKLTYRFNNNKTKEEDGRGWY